jgi:metal-responsive CopG/Arc/MetJ family transcriptional regulator
MSPKEAPVKTSTINLSMPEDLLKRADAVAEREMRSRSEVMRAALQFYIERRGLLDRLFAIMDKHSSKRGLKPSDVAQAVQDVRSHK